AAHRLRGGMIHRVLVLGGLPEPRLRLMATAACFATDKSSFGGLLGRAGDVVAADEPSAANQKEQHPRGQRQEQGAAKATERSNGPDVALGLGRRRCRPSLLPPAPLT